MRSSFHRAPAPRSNREPPGRRAFWLFVAAMALAVAGGGTVVLLARRAAEQRRQQPRAAPAGPDAPGRGAAAGPTTP